MQKKPISYFYGSFSSLFIAIVIGYWLNGVVGAYTVALLAVLETSLSLDNAVVNAAVLDGWDRFWRQLFLVVGLPIAVFGMRLVFPVLIVSSTTGMGMWEAFQLAMNKPDDYAQALLSSHHQVAAFGGAFLMMVALQFFLDEEKDLHWLAPIEKLFAGLGRYEVAVEAGIVLAVVIIVAQFTGMDEHEELKFIVAGVYGFLTYIGAKFFGQLLSGGEGDGKKVAQGIGGLMYLEILDASFSFDGVIGAFAITNNLFIIMLGLGVGAMFVRSLTIFLVDKGTLGELRYLEHGAFWAIAALAVIMFVGVKVEIPDWITGLIGAAFIGLSFWSSVRANKQDSKNGVVPDTVEHH